MPNQALHLSTKKHLAVQTLAEVIELTIDPQEWYPLYKISNPNMLFVLYSIALYGDDYIEKY